MASLSSASSSGSTPASEFSAQNIPCCAEFPVSGVANILFYEETDEACLAAGEPKYSTLLLEGDRRHMDGVPEWENHWHKATEDGVLKGAPHSIYLSKDKLVLTGKEFDKMTVAAAQMKHAVTKGWVPKVLAETPEMAHSIASTEEFSVTHEQLMTFHELMISFTNKTRGSKNQEFVAGRRDDGEDLFKCLKRETWEESGVDITDKAYCDKPIFIGYSDPFGSPGRKRVTAIFVTKMVNYCDTLSCVDSMLYLRRPTGFEYECAHSYFKHLPGIDECAAKAEKATLEVTGGKFFPLDLSQPHHPLMDVKNKAFADKFVAYLTKAVEPAQKKPRRE